MSNLHAQQSQQLGSIIPPRSQSSAAQVRSPATGSVNEPEQRPLAHGHLRQLSKAHGNHTQSRNAIFVNSPIISPMSPDHADGLSGSAAIFDHGSMVHRGVSQRQPSKSPSTMNPAASHSTKVSASSSNLVPDREQGDFGRVTATLKRLDRAQSSKGRREHSHHRSHSRNQQEQKTVGEYALHHLFNKFLARADYKINQCLLESNEAGSQVEQICGVGADSDFDQLISALAHITRRKPKPLVDTIILWRRGKGKEANDLSHEASSPNPLQKGTVRRNMEHVYPDPASTNDEIKYAAEQRSAIAVYLTCRVLIEVFNKADPSALQPVLYDKLEGIIFGQLQKLKPDLFQVYPFRMANWKIFSQLLGVMSSMSLSSVSRCFTNELKVSQSQLNLNVKGIAGSELESRVKYMIMAMQHLHIRTHPESLWKDSCECMYTISELFVDAHGQQIKHAYCEILETLVITVAAEWEPRILSQRWKDFLHVVNTRLASMLVKPRHWAEAFRLSTVILCASPTEYFASHWLSMATSLQAKLKDRIMRPSALQAICRLVWTYLNRLQEAPAIALRKLDDVMKTVIPSGKKTYISSDHGVSEAIIELIRIIGHRYQEYCFRNVIFPLMNSDLFVTGKDIKVDQLEPDKMVVGIKAFLAVMADLEKGDQGHPPFPRFAAAGQVTVAHLMFESQQYSANFLAGIANSDPSFTRPINVNQIGDIAKDYYARFCEVLGKITLICDNAFGGQAVLDEKFSTLTPKTPIAETFTFGRREDHTGPADHRLGFYELLYVAVRALPRCQSANIQQNPLINLLCTCTAHVQPNIAISSTQSLKAIARQSLAQPVTIGFARFIFNFDARYSTMSDEGMLGLDHIEITLRLYVELLQIWIEEIRRKTKDATSGMSPDASFSSRGLQLDLASVTNHVDEIESHGVFFLCSQSRRVRAFAVKVLKIVTEFDSALGRHHPRIIQILEGDSQSVMDINDESLTVAERSRLQKGKGGSIGQHTLIELSSSDVSYDATLWLKLFPNIIRLSFSLCPSAVMLGREIVCARLLQMNDTITRLDLDSRVPAAPVNAQSFVRIPNMLQTMSPEIVMEQWKLYLIMACTTMTNAGAQTQSQLDKTQHARKISKTMMQGQDGLSSARSLFSYVIPLLSADQSQIRDAIVIALSSININLYRTLLESLQYAVTTCKEEAKQRIGIHQRTGSHPRKNRSTDRLRTETTQVYRLTARFLLEPSVLQDDWILGNICTYTKDLMIFLSDAEIQNDWECQKLRRQYCGLLEELFSGTNRTKDPSQYMAFESRKSAFALMEDWCGYSPNQSRIAQREDKMRTSALEFQLDNRERTNLTAAMETEKKDLSTAALSAMAALCAGPIRVRTDRGETLSFDGRRMLSWVHQIFGTLSDKLHSIGRRALYSLIVYNQDHPYLLETSVEHCFATGRPRALESYFDVVTRVLIEHSDYPLPFWRILSAVLFALGNENGEIRIRSAKLIQRLEQRQHQNSKIQDFDISISDKTVAVYKLAQFEISKRLSKQHTQLAFFVFSQFSAHFKNIHPDSQRNMVAAILPWVQVIELQLDPSGGPTAQSYMLLANLLEITTTASGVLHNEIQALWQALATGPHGGNVQLVLDFVISLCLDRKDQSFVYYAKQIIVYLSSTPAGQRVVDFLLLQITPKNMVDKKRDPMVHAGDNHSLPYVADLSEILPSVREQDKFSLGQLSVVFLVDLMVAPVNLDPSYVPLLLQATFVLWDHQISLVQEQAREMLVHLIHELVICKIEDERATIPKKHDVEGLVELIRKNDAKVIWQYREKAGRYEDWSGGDEVEDQKRVPVAMPYVTRQVIEVFSLAYPNIQDQLAKISLSWGTSCPVRHIACRSLQIFRCILVPLDRQMLSDILARISNTVVHEADDVQLFSMEMLTTVKSIMADLKSEALLEYPHLFWTTCACLNTIFEREFIATLGMLHTLLVKVDLSDPVVVRILEKAKPARWQGTFDGIAPLVYKGLKSELSLQTSLHVLDAIIVLPSSGLVGDSSRLLFTILAHLPRFLESFDNESLRIECVKTARNLIVVAEFQDADNISMVLNAFAKRQYAARSEFLSQLLSTLERAFVPTWTGQDSWELQTLIFVIGLLNNRSHWYKVKTLELLRALVKMIDTHRPEIASCGPDLIAPLLRLLQTQYCPQAIEILDHIMFMSETSMTKHHIRMSMAGLGPRSSLVRKEYEKTQSLYGIPEETGWSVPMPAIHSETTRLNMQAIYQTCADPGTPTVGSVPTPEIEFHRDEEQQSSYFSLERSDTMRTEESSTSNNPEGGMGDLLNKLNSLDDYFDETLDNENHDSNRYSALTVTQYTPDLDNGAELYDTETAPILQRTLARTASITSLHNGSIDQRSHPGVMSPTAFSSPNPTSVPPQRPALHSRSITSPANSFANPSNNVSDLLSDEDAEESLSEDERATGHNVSGGARPLGSSSLRSAQTSLRKIVPGGEGKEYRQRGLLSRSQSRGHGQLPGSPKVPKVPEAYLRDNRADATVPLHPIH